MRMISTTAELRGRHLTASRLLDLAARNVLLALKAYDPDQPRAPGGT
jgi:hypothetical protein